MCNNGATPFELLHAGRWSSIKVAEEYYENTSILTDRRLDIFLAGKKKRASRTQEEKKQGPVYDGFTTSLAVPSNVAVSSENVVDVEGKVSYSNIPNPYKKKKTKNAPVTTTVTHSHTYHGNTFVFHNANFMSDQFTNTVDSLLKKQK